MYSEISSALAKIAAQHASALNAPLSFGEKWNSEAGIFLRALTIPEKDLSRISAQTLSAILYELGKTSVDSGFNFSMAAHLLAAVIPLGGHGTSSVHSQALDSVAGGSICANAITESVSGGDSFKMQTTALRVNQHYVLNGSKTYVTNGPVARFFIVYALTDPSKGFFGGVSCFLLDQTKHKFTCGPAIEKSSLRNSPMCELFFNDCEVEAEYIIGKEGAGAMIFMESMDWERSCIAAMHAGTIRRLCDLATSHVKNRVRGGKTLADFQNVQFKIADLELMAETALLMSNRAARLTDSRHGTLAAAQAKILCSEYLLESAKITTELHGAYGITGATGFTDILADAQAALIYSGPNDVLRDLVAAQL